MTLLRCISLHQPFASLIAAGVKIHETRDFFPPQKAIGQPLIIHAAARKIMLADLSLEVVRICQKTFGDGWVHTLPLGCFVCATVLEHARDAALAEETAAEDIACGNWGPGRVAWRLRLVGKFPLPVPAKGRQRWWYVEESELA